MTRTLAWTVTLTLAACGPDPELVAEMDRLSAQVTQLQQTVDRVERERDALRSRAERQQGELADMKVDNACARMGVTREQGLQARLDTSMGTVHCDLWPTKAPQTVLNFVELAEGKREWTEPRSGEKVKKPLYDGTIFHRVIPGFMVQGGDPLGNGRGGPGYKFEDEIDPTLKFDRPGLLAMANSGPNTNGSQFFITDSTPTHLNGKHTIFGECEEMDVVKAITDVDRGPRDRPEQDVTLRRVTILRAD